MRKTNRKGLRERPRISAASAIGIANPPMIGRTPLKFDCRRIPAQKSRYNIFVERVGKPGIVVDLDLIGSRIGMCHNIGPLKIGNGLVDRCAVGGMREQQAGFNCRLQAGDGLGKGGGDAQLVKPHGFGADGEFHTLQIYARCARLGYIPDDWLCRSSGITGNERGRHTVTIPLSHQQIGGILIDPRRVGGCTGRIGPHARVDKQIHVAVAIRIIESDVHPHVAGGASSIVKFHPATGIGSGNADQRRKVEIAGLQINRRGPVADGKLGVTTPDVPSAVLIETRRIAEPKTVLSPVHSDFFAVGRFPTTCPTNAAVRPATGQLRAQWIIK